RTNSLIVAAPSLLIEDIEKLVAQMEKGASESKQIVKVVSVKGVDPTLVQHAIDAISGRATSASRPTTGGTTFPGGGSGVFPTPGGGFFPAPGGGGNFGAGGGAGRFGGGGGPPGGGGFQGAGGGGNRGPGGGGGGGGMRRPGGGMQSRGPDFFGQRVTDDPE